MNQMVQAISDILVRTFTYSYNICVIQGCFPDVVNVTQIIPICKKGVWLGL